MMVTETLAKIVLIFVLCTVAKSVPLDRTPPTEFDCATEPGASRPVEIYNSMYYLDEDGNLCCPLNADYCISEERVNAECAKLGRGVKHEPCFHCLTCAKNRGESCKGKENIYGLCDEGLECIGHEDDENGVGVCVPEGDEPPRQLGEDCGGRLNSLGECDSGLDCTEVLWRSNNVCVMGDQHQQWNESCGGKYGKLGRCDPNQNLRCSVDEELFKRGEDISGTCYGNDQKSSCFQDCSTKPDIYVCATDGVWYRHKCYYRKKNCGLREEADKIRKTSDDFCGELPTVKSAETAALSPPPPTTENVAAEEEERSDLSGTNAMATAEDSTPEGTDTNAEAIENSI